MRVGLAGWHRALSSRYRHAPAGPHGSHASYTVNLRKFAHCPSPPAGSHCVVTYNRSKSGVAALKSNIELPASTSGRDRRSRRLADRLLVLPARRPNPLADSRSGGFKRSLHRSHCGGSMWSVTSLTGMLTDTFGRLAPPATDRWGSPMVRGSLCARSRWRRRPCRGLEKYPHYIRVDKSSHVTLRVFGVQLQRREARVKIRIELLETLGAHFECPEQRVPYLREPRADDGRFLRRTCRQEQSRRPPPSRGRGARRRRGRGSPPPRRAAST